MIVAKRKWEKITGSKKKRPKRKNGSRINFTALGVINYREDVSTPRVLNICVFRAPPGTLTL